MSLNAYSTGKTAQQIVEDCERAARYPRLNFDTVLNTGAEPADGLLNNAQAYRWLNDVLKEAYILFDWPGTQKAITIQLLSRSQSLPADFWKLQFEDGIFVLLDNSRPQLRNKTREDFFANMRDDSQKAIPEYFYIDRNQAGSLFVDPWPDKTYLAELHYFALPGTLATKATVPDFPYDMYLFWSLLERYYLDQNDQRLSVAQQNKNKILMEIRGGNVAFDHNEQDSSSTMDRRRFHGMPWSYE